MFGQFLYCPVERLSCELNPTKYVSNLLNTTDLYQKFIRSLNEVPSKKIYIDSQSSPSKEKNCQFKLNQPLSTVF